MKTLASMPVAPHAVPLLGNLLPLARNPLGLIQSLPDRGDLVRLRFGPVETVVVCTLDLTWEVFSQDRIFDRGGIIFEQLGEVTGDGLGTCPHSRHRRQRRLLQPTFHKSRMLEYGRLMAANIETVVDGWNDGQVIDVLTEMNRITSSTIAATIFSDSLPPDALWEVLDYLQVGMGGIYKRMLTPSPLDRLPTPGNLRFRRAQRRARAVLADVIRARRRDGADHGDLLSTLLSTRDHQGDSLGLSDDEVINQVLTFFFAGMDTTASGISSTLGLLAEHPAIQEELQAEVDTVLAGRPATYDDIPKLDLASRALSEALRMWSPGWLLTRTVATDTDLGGYRLPAGTTVIVSPHLIQRQSRVFERPDSFDPDRWLPERASSLPRHAYLAFGGGARKCIGDKFGVTESILTLTAIVSRWNLKTLPDHRLQPSNTAVMAPKNLRLQMQARPAIRRQSGPAMAQAVDAGDA